MKPLNSSVLAVFALLFALGGNLAIASDTILVGKVPGGQCTVAIDARGSQSGVAGEAKSYLVAAGAVTRTRLAGGKVRNVTALSNSSVLESTYSSDSSGASISFDWDWVTYLACADMLGVEQDEDGVSGVSFGGAFAETLYQAMRAAGADLHPVSSAGGEMLHDTYSGSLIACGKRADSGVRCSLEPKP